MFINYRRKTMLSKNWTKDRKRKKSFHGADSPGCRGQRNETEKYAENHYTNKSEGMQPIIIIKQAPRGKCWTVGLLSHLCPVRFSSVRAVALRLGRVSGNSLHFSG